MSAAAKKAVDTRPDLPTRPQKGDRVRLKESQRAEYQRDCTAAGWDIDPDAIRVVLRVEPWNAGERLAVEGAPFFLGSSHVELAWNTEDERRAMLQRNGWRV